jgi:hypothetical protein
MPEQKSSSVPWYPVSRRRFLAAGAGAVVAGGVVSGCAHGPKMPGTTPKEQAQYQDHPNGLSRCGLCKHYIPNNGCEVVAGPVSPDGWCRFYALF